MPSSLSLASRNRRLNERKTRLRAVVHKHINIACTRFAGDTGVSRRTTYRFTRERPPVRWTSPAHLDEACARSPSSGRRSPVPGDAEALSSAAVRPAGRPQRACAATLRGRSRFARCGRLGWGLRITVSRSASNSSWASASVSSSSNRRRAACEPHREARRGRDRRRRFAVIRRMRAVLRPPRQPILWANRPGDRPWSCAAPQPPPSLHRGTCTASS